MWLQELTILMKFKRFYFLSTLGHEGGCDALIVLLGVRTGILTPPYTIDSCFSTGCFYSLDTSTHTHTHRSCGLRRLVSILCTSWVMEGNPRQWKLVRTGQITTLFTVTFTYTNRLWSISRIRSFRFIMLITHYLIRFISYCYWWSVKELLKFTPELRKESVLVIYWGFREDISSSTS